MSIEIKLDEQIASRRMLDILCFCDFGDIVAGNRKRPLIIIDGHRCIIHVTHV